MVDIPSTVRNGICSAKDTDPCNYLYFLVSACVHQVHTVQFCLTSRDTSCPCKQLFFCISSQISTVLGKLRTVHACVGRQVVSDHWCHSCSLLHWIGYASSTAVISFLNWFFLLCTKYCIPIPGKIILLYSNFGFFMLFLVMQYLCVFLFVNDRSVNVLPKIPLFDELSHLQYPRCELCTV